MFRFQSNRIPLVLSVHPVFARCRCRYRRRQWSGQRSVASPRVWPALPWWVSERLPKGPKASTVVAPILAADNINMSNEREVLYRFIAFLFVSNVPFYYCLCVCRMWTNVFVIQLIT